MNLCLIRRRKPSGMSIMLLFISVISTELYLRTCIRLAKRGYYSCDQISRNSEIGAVDIEYAFLGSRALAWSIKRQTGPGTRNDGIYAR